MFYFFFSRPKALFQEDIAGDGKDIGFDARAAFKLFLLLPEAYEDLLRHIIDGYRSQAAVMGGNIVSDNGLILEVYFFDGLDAVARPQHQAGIGIELCIGPIAPFQGYTPQAKFFAHKLFFRRGDQERDILMKKGSDFGDKFGAGTREVSGGDVPVEFYRYS